MMLFFKRFQDYYFLKELVRMLYSCILLIVDNIYLPISILFSAFFIYFLYTRYRNLILYKNLSVCIFFILFLVYGFFLEQNFVNLLTSCFFFVLCFYITLSFILLKNNIVTKILLLFPIINIVILPIQTTEYFLKKRYKKLIPILSIMFLFFGIMLFLSFCILYSVEKLTWYDLFKTSYYRVSSIDKKLYYASYNVASNIIDPKHLKEIDGYSSFIREGHFIKKINFKINIKTQMQDLKVNRERKELYAYDSLNNKIFIIDMKTGDIKKERQLYGYIYVHHANFLSKNVTQERICFDNKSKTIALALEDSNFYIFDMDTLDIIKVADIPIESDEVVFNEVDDSYVLSFWAMTPYIYVFYINKEKKTKKIPMPVCQGEIAFSNINKELYLPLHQQGEIYVLDAKTYELKRKIKVRYGVKNITYNQEYNILIATSYFTGYLDIISLDNIPNKVIYSKYVHYHSRQPVLWGNIVVVPTPKYLYKYDISEILDKIKEKKG